jgi:hypothetical protein
MGDDRWIDGVRQAGVLRFTGGRTLHGGAWQGVLTASVSEINSLLQTKNVSLRFEPAGEAGAAQLQIEATAGPIPAEAGGGTLPADGRHGATRLTLVGRRGDDDSALRAQSGRIFVPLAPAGHRTRPPRAMMQVMMVHELLHAAGLRAHNNAMDDIMTAQMEDGRGGKVHPWGGLGQDMPPCVLGGGTVSRLQALWGQRRSP